MAASPASDMASVRHLDTLLKKATDASTPTEDWQAIMTFVEAVKTTQEGVMIAVRLLLSGLQSRNEVCAVRTIVVLDTCAVNCGKDFQQEIGKFRFLNELIKLISPKYLAMQTPVQVQKRIKTLFRNWSRNIPSEPKIIEALNMLLKQGIITEEEDDKVVNANQAQSPNATSPESRTRGKSIFEDDEKSKHLARLLRSNHPDDLQAANRLIKNMVKQDQHKLEKHSQRLNDLERARNNGKLLSDMLDYYSTSSSGQEKETMEELYRSCEEIRNQLQKNAGEVESDEALLQNIIKVSEELSAVMERYQNVMAGKAATTNQVSKSEVLLTQAKTDVPLVPGPAAAPPRNDLLLDMGFNSSVSSSTASMTTSASPARPDGNDTSLLDKQLAELGLGNLDSSLSQPVNRPANTSVNPGTPISPASHDIFSMNEPSTPMMSGFGTNTTLQSTGMGSPGPNQSNAVFGGNPGWPNSNTNNASPVNLIGSMGGNQAVMETAYSAAKREALEKSQQSGKGNIVLEKSSALDLLAQLDTNKSGSGTMSPSTSDNQLLKPASPSNTDPIQALPNLTVPLESIKPGQTEPITAYDKNGIKTLIYTAQDAPMQGITSHIISTMSFLPFAISKFVFEAAVPKTQGVKLQPPSASSLAARNPIEAPATVTQVMLIANPAMEKVRLKFRISYEYNGNSISDMGELEWMPELSASLS
ncbi:ADP-ribosylation factor-binding protein GGA3 [Trichoplax sp. H2]|nr:ADP-ribosylation factor-binding protein GGA3 [Trichoplax sp. H2]|eukprot:RDD43995.1 ADP-ribosylation factor-binding protein GGA3 [Trichoplax sp. H2]